MFSIVIQGDSSNGVKWTVLIFSLIIGTAVGYITAKTAKIGLFTLGLIYFFHFINIE